MLIVTVACIVNTDHVVRISPMLGDATRSVLTFTDSSTFDAPLPVEAFEQVCGVVVPAQPGFLLVEAVLPPPEEDEQEIFFRESPVVAFGIAQGDCGPQPITAEGEPQTGEDFRFVVQQWNGPCTGRSGWYAELAEFKAECERAVVSRRA